MNPAWGPPNIIGTPKRCDDPTAMSAPHSPGGDSRVRARRSVATTTTIPAAFASSTVGIRSRTSPLAPGYWSRTPKDSPSRKSMSSGWATATSMSIHRARARMTSMVWGKASVSTQKRRARRRREIRRAMVMASAAAVPSSSREALEISKPVRSETMVWKLSSASSRPWEISGW